MRGRSAFPASYGRIDDLLGPATGRFSRRQPAGRNASRAEYRLFTRAFEVAAQAGDVAGVHGDADAVDESERLVGGYLLQVYDIYTKYV